MIFTRRKIVSGNHFLIYTEQKRSTIDKCWKQKRKFYTTTAAGCQNENDYLEGQIKALIINLIIKDSKTFIMVKMQSSHSMSCLCTLWSEWISMLPSSLIGSMPLCNWVEKSWEAPICFIVYAHLSRARIKFI